MYQGVLDAKLWDRIGDVEDASNIIHRIEDSLDEIWELPHSLRPLVEASYMTALRATFSTTVGFAFLALTCGFLVQQLVLHSSLARNDDSGAAKRCESDEADPENT